MKIIVLKEAQAWFERELGIGEGRGVRFYGKVYGCSPIHDNFSLAMEVNVPSRPSVQTIINDIPYYVEDGDEWFFDGYDLEIQYDAKRDEPIYVYNKI